MSKTSRKHSVQLEKKHFFILFAINFLLIMLSYLPYMMRLFSADSFAHIAHGGFDYQAHLLLGRPFSYLAYKALYLMGVSIPLLQVGMKMFLSLCLAFSATALTGLFVRITGIKNHFKVAITNIGVLLSFINIYMQELFYFPEATVGFGLGILFVALSVFSFYFFKGIKALAISLLFLVISLGFYQINIQFFVIWGLLFLLLESNLIPNKKLFSRFFSLAGIGGAGIAVTILILRVLQWLKIAEVTARDISFSALKSNVYSVFVGLQAQLWGVGGRTVPGNYLVLLLFLGLLGLLIYMIAKKKLPFRQWCTVFALLGCGYISILLVHAFSGVVWTPPRTLYGFYGLFTSLVLLLIFLGIERLPQKLTIGLCVFFLLFSVYHIQGFATAQASMNIEDAAIARQVKQEIIEHEQETGVAVQKLAFTTDAGTIWAYPFGAEHIAFDQGVRTWVVSWSVIHMFNYYTQSNLQLIDMPNDIYEAYFKDKNWNIFDIEEQVVILGDTVYIATY